MEDAIMKKILFALFVLTCFTNPTYPTLENIADDEAILDGLFADRKEDARNTGFMA